MSLIMIWATEKYLKGDGYIIKLLAETHNQFGIAVAAATKFEEAVRSVESAASGCNS
jgi:hypothetical protein